MLELLQPVQKKDVLALARMYEIFMELVVDEKTLEDTWEAVQQQKGHHLLGYYKDGALLASIVAVICPQLTGDCRSFMVVENVVVSDACRGQGIGKILMGAVEELAEQQGCTSILLVSTGHRKDAHRFYEQCGYDEDVRGFRKHLA